MIPIVTILTKLLLAVGPVTAALPEFKAVWDDLVKTFAKGTDQTTLQNLYTAIQQENAAGHQSLQQELTQAAQE